MLCFIDIHTAWTSPLSGQARESFLCFEALHRGGGVWKMLQATWLGKGRCGMGEMEEPIISDYTRAGGTLGSNLEKLG